MRHTEKETIILWTEWKYAREREKVLFVGERERERERERGERERKWERERVIERE